jgi:hypothetical protein
VEALRGELAHGLDITLAMLGEAGKGRAQDDVLAPRRKHTRTTDLSHHATVQQ